MRGAARDAGRVMDGPIRRLGGAALIEQCAPSDAHTRTRALHR